MAHGARNDRSSHSFGVVTGQTSWHGGRSELTNEGVQTSFGVLYGDGIAGTLAAERYSIKVGSAGYRPRRAPPRITIPSLSHTILCSPSRS